MQAPDQIERDAWIDLLRVASVAVVVIGHWVTTTVIWEDDRIGIENALSVVRGSHISTWLIQVMPVMFFVGGFSNYRSYDRHDRAYLGFLRSRLARLLAPTLVFVGIWTVIGFVAQVSDLGLPNIVDRAADLAALPFWFLGLYLFVVALAPMMLQLHRRFGSRAAGAMAGGAALVDLVHHGLGVPHIGYLNFALVWLLAHQIGFLYADGSLVRLSQRAVLAATAAGLAMLVLLTTVGGYPVSLVGVPGDERWNTNPPSLALVALTCWLIGLALLAREPLQRSARRWQPWIALGNASVLTVFLWHVSALAIAAAVVYPLGMPRPGTGTAEWWILRPVWIVAAGVVLLLLVALFQRFEVHPKPHPATSALRSSAGIAAVGVVLTGFAILGFGVTGFNRPTARLGEDLLGLELTPVLNLLHLCGGILLLIALYSWPMRRRRLGLWIVSVFLLGLGWLGVGGVELLGTNSGIALVHAAIGVVGLGVLLSSRLEERR